MEKLRSIGRFVRDLVAAFSGDECPEMAAALSYYTIFAIPPLLGLLALLGSRFVNPTELRELVSEQVESFVGDSATQIVDVVQGAVEPEFSGPTAVIALLALVFGATGVFVQLQDALNAAWGVKRDPRTGDVRTFLVKRGVSLLMIASFGLLLLVSVLASAVISLFRRFLGDIAPEWMLGLGLPIADLGFSLVAVAVLFTLVLRFVPDAEVLWKEALAGGIFTAALFTIGKLLIGYYLARSEPGSVYGAAGSFAVALIWIYYSSMILLLGAEFTVTWACRHGKPVTPQRGAVRVKRQVVYAEGRNEGREVKAA